MPTAVFRGVDGSTIRVSGDVSLAGLATSRSHFDYKEWPGLPLFESGPPDLPERLRQASELRPDLTVVEEQSFSIRGATVQVARVLRKSSSDVYVGGDAFLMAAWRGETGTILTSLPDGKLAKAAALLGGVPIREDKSGPWVDLPINSKVRLPIFLMSFEGPVLLIAEPMTRALAETLPLAEAQDVPGGKTFGIQRRATFEQNIASPSTYVSLCGVAERAEDITALASTLVLDWS